MVGAVATDRCRFKTAGMPVRSGRVAVAGLDADVTIRYSDTCVPHITASSERDMVFAMGYVHASERLLQMDGGRRVASGRLSELFGPDTLGIDTFFRTIGMHRTARQAMARADEKTREMLAAYAAGVNRYAESNTLPLSYRIPGMRFEFTPWKAEDSAVMGVYMAFLLASNWERELVGQMLLAERGEAAAKMMLPARGSDGPFTMRPTLARGEKSPGSNAARSIARSRGAGRGMPDVCAAELARLLAFGRPGVGSSNSWVVSGAYTKSGKPILANDPHLGLELPSVWYEIGLSCPGVEAAGVSLPGIPYIIIGRTPDTAWGSTTGFGDTQDLYVLKPVKGDTSKYVYDGSARAFDVVTERIVYVEDGERKERAIDVRISRHGPVISDVVPEWSGAPLALKWTSLDPAHYDFRAAELIAKARDWKSFRDALRGFAFMSQNWLYADTSGTIAFINAGAVPERKAGHDGSMPVPGWTAEYEWDGYIPWEELPQLENPESGFILTANNPPLPPGEYAHGFSTYYCMPYRAARITEMLAEALPKGGVTADDMRRMQLDLLSVRARRMAPFMVSAVKNVGGELNGVQKSALALLESWDYVMSADSAATTVFHETCRRSFEMAYVDEMSEQAYRRYRGNGQIEEIDLLYGTDSPLFDDRRTPDKKETHDEVIDAAFRKAVEVLALKLGGDPAQWRWGRLHTITFDHPFALADRGNRGWFSEGPHELGGSLATVWMAWPEWWSEDYECTWGPSMRFVIDMADVESSSMVVPPGQSGHVPCRHYADQIDDWLSGRSHTMPLEPEGVNKTYSGSVLVLTPE
jgi:penicillin amidase